MIISTVAGRRPLEKDTAYVRRDANQIFLYFCPFFAGKLCVGSQFRAKKKPSFFKEKIQHKRKKEAEDEEARIVPRYELPNLPSLPFQKKEVLRAIVDSPIFLQSLFFFLFLLVVAKMDSWEEKESRKIENDSFSTYFAVNSVFCRDTVWKNVRGGLAEYYSLLPLLLWHSKQQGHFSSEEEELGGGGEAPTSLSPTFLLLLLLLDPHIPNQHAEPKNGALSPPPRLYGVWKEGETERGEKDSPQFSSF